LEASARQIPRLIFLANANLKQRWPADWIDCGPDAARIETLRHRLRERHIVAEFSSVPGLKEQILVSLMRQPASTRKEQIKAARASMRAGAYAAAEEILASVVVADPKCTEAWLLRAINMFGGRPPGAVRKATVERALHFASRATASDPKNGDCDLLMALIKEHGYKAHYLRVPPPSVEEHLAAAREHMGKQNQSDDFDFLCL
jgi:hypothetical protein